MAEPNRLSETNPEGELRKRPQPEPSEATTNPPPSSLPQNDKKRKLDHVGYQNSTFFKIRILVKDLRPSFVEVLHAPNFRESKAAHEIRKKMQVIMDLSKQLKLETLPLDRSRKPFEDQPPLAAESREEPPVRIKEEVKQSQPSELPAVKLSQPPVLPRLGKEEIKQSPPPEVPPIRTVEEIKLSHPPKLPSVRKEELKPSQPPGIPPIKAKEEIKRSHPPEPAKSPENMPVDKLSDAKELETRAGVGLHGTYVVGGSPMGWNFIMFPGSESLYYGETREGFIARRARKVSLKC